MKIMKNSWQVAIRNTASGMILTDKGTPFNAVPNPGRMEAADPFVLEVGEKLYIFAELFSLIRWRGEIGYCVYENGVFSKWTTVARGQHHFSYPYIFKDKGDVYIMPESGSMSEIAVYKAVKFPQKFEKLKVMHMGGRMVDTTILTGKYFISYQMDETAQGDNKLVLMRYDNGKLLEIFEEKDTENVLRPAGAAFWYRNNLVRPAQDGRNGYGSAIEFRNVEIDEDNNSLKETKVGRVDPSEIQIIGTNKKIEGIHTYNSTQNYEIIDFRYKNFTLMGILGRILQKLKK